MNEMNGYDEKCEKCIDCKKKEVQELPHGFLAVYCPSSCSRVKVVAAKKVKEEKIVKVA